MVQSERHGVALEGSMGLETLTTWFTDPTLGKVVAGLLAIVFARVVTGIVARAPFRASARRALKIRGSSPVRPWSFALLGAGCWTLLGVAAANATQAPSASPAQPARSASGGGPAAGDAPPAEVDEPARRSEKAQAFADTAARVRDLLADRLAPELEPRSLFDVDISDPHVVQIERQRLEQLTREAAPKDADQSSGAKLRHVAKAVVDRALSEPADAGAAEIDAGAPEPLLVTPDEVSARLDLDRARLEFYRLPMAARDRLLSAHQAHQAAAVSGSEKQLDDAEKRARVAEEEREQALESARTARSEALRLVAEEQARLLAVAQRQAEFEKLLVTSRAALAQRKEEVLGWHRKVRETIDAATRAKLDPAAVDAVYASLRNELRSSRDRLASALSGVRATSAVPEADEDSLSALAADVNQAPARQQRKVVEQEASRLIEIERQLRIEQVRELYDDVVSLNRDRLGLYPHLSDAWRNEVVGFGPAGLDQAQAEVRQVVLVLRRHLQAAGQFVTALRGPGAARSDSALTATTLAFKWLLPLGVFTVWRRRAERTLSAMRDASREERRSHRQVALSPIERTLAFVLRVRSPVEWLMLLAAIVWLLPSAARTTLEVQLLTTIFGWTLGGSAVVAAIDGLAAQGETGPRKSRMIAAHVRLRSLRLLGRVVVAVALVLSLSDQLVGRGTIYSWVLSTCWFTAIPVVLLLARWWHDIIHERLAQKRRKNALEAWVVAHDTGWRSMPAALLGGALLLGRGALRQVRQRATTFDLTRRVLAYLFRRDMSRRGDTAHVAYGPLSAPVFEALGPETASHEIVPSIADDEIAQVVDHIRAAGGGLFAVVGERGAGKSTLLGRLSEQAGDVKSFNCPLGGEAALGGALAKAVGARPDATLDDAAALVNGERTVALLIDDAHRLILPRMGGLDSFDQLLTAARRHSSSCSWVFAFDEVVWRFFERARGARPLFDDVIRLEPWREEAIARLLVSRTKQAGLTPNFERLLPALPDDADEVDRAEATERTSAGYYRLLWDYASGNPGIALHAWRSCLGAGADGEPIVKVFDPPNTSDLEALPDSAVFVLRAVIQLEFAHPDEIELATMLEPADIEDALRFGLNRGYFRLSDGRYWVTWSWFRPITRFLQRRYLLSAA